MSSIRHRARPIPGTGKGADGSALTRQRVAAAVGWPFVAALLFAALVVSVMAHTAYYGLIQRYEANLLAPLTLMTPLSAIGFGVALNGETLDGRMIAGAGLALMGVLVVALRARPATPLLAEREQA